MRPGRPTKLAVIERDLMTQLPTGRADNRKSAAQMLDLARGFQQSALDDVPAGRPLPATSSFHEAARIAITAVATANGRRFSNTSGHEAAIDYALGVGIVNAADHTRLDELRELRPDINYPEDLVTPSAADLEAIRSLVDRVIATCTAKVNAPAARAWTDEAVTLPTITTCRYGWRRCLQRAGPGARAAHVMRLARERPSNPVVVMILNVVVTVAARTRASTSSSALAAKFAVGLDDLTGEFGRSHHHLSGRRAGLNGPKGRVPSHQPRTSGDRRYGPSHEASFDAPGPRCRGIE